MAYIQMTAYSMDLKALHILRQNIRALLDARRESEATLAPILGFKSRSSLNKFLNGDRSGFQMSRLDQLGKFFGLPVYQLFQPGISPLLERRGGDRRSGRERRIGHAQRHVVALAVAVEPHRPGRKGRAHVVASSPLVEELRKLAAEYERRVTAAISQAESRGQIAGPGVAEPNPPRRRRSVRGSDPSTSKDELT